MTSFVKDEITTSKASRKLGRALVRQAGTWDPFLQCLNLDKRTNLSLSNKIHRHYKGLKKKKKKDCMHAQLGQIMDNKTQKDQRNPTATSKELGAKAGYCTCPLLTAQLKGWANHLGYPSGLTPGPTLTLTPMRSQLASLKEQAKKPVTSSRSPLLQQGPQ